MSKVVLDIFKIRNIVTENKKKGKIRNTVSDFRDDRGRSSKLYASAYQLYLPDKAFLQAKVKEWIEEFEENNMVQ